MQANTNNLVSLSEANQNFSKVAKLVESSGSAVVLKNNVPKYVILDYVKFEELKMSQDERLENIAMRLIEQNSEALTELAK